MKLSHRVPVSLCSLVALCVGAPLCAQDFGTEPLIVNGEAERYLRALQVTGHASLYPWSVRGFSRLEVMRFAPDTPDHPWAERLEWRATPPPGSFRLIGPSGELIYNSAFPYGWNDGPLWAGKGITSAVQVGAATAIGPVSVVVAPHFSVAQNSEFPLLPNGHEDRLRFADGRNPLAIDRPQRWGNEPFLKVDPGSSAVDVALPRVRFGVSSMAQHWGPAHDLPLILGSNAGGFPHLYLGTSLPQNIGIGRLHARLTWGLLGESPYSGAHPDSARRLASGLAAVLTPVGFQGLELGASRFFHRVYDGDLGAAFWTQPLSELFRSAISKHADDPDHPDFVLENQLISVFFRWTLPRSGAEIYGEYARDDYGYNFRDIILEPDHASAFLLGFGKGWSAVDDRLTLFRFELLNAASTHLQQVRGQQEFYTHTIRQGHTHRGQILGSPAAYGGSGVVASAEFYGPGGRTGVRLTRLVNADRSTPGRPDRLDAFYTGGIEIMRFRGEFAAGAGLEAVYNANRNGGDGVFNLNLRFRLIGGL